MPVTTTLTGTIVFTDIVGFTQLTDEHGDDLAVTMLERQEQLVRRTLPEGARVVKEPHTDDTGEPWQYRTIS